MSITASPIILCFLSLYYCFSASQSLLLFLSLPALLLCVLDLAVVVWSEMHCRASALRRIPLFYPSYLLPPFCLKLIDTKSTLITLITIPPFEFGAIFKILKNRKNPAHHNIYYIYVTNTHIYPIPISSKILSSDSPHWIVSPSFLFGLLFVCFFPLIDLFLFVNLIRIFPYLRIPIYSQRILLLLILPSLL